MSNPLDFVSNFLAQPYPTMGLAPSSAITKTGGTIVQEGTGRVPIGKTSESMWARIASGVPFGWTLASVVGGANAVSGAAQTVKTKTEEGAQAVEGKVKSLVEPAKQFLTGTASTIRWIAFGLIAVAFIVFAAQVKTLVRAN